VSLPLQPVQRLGDILDTHHPGDRMAVLPVLVVKVAMEQPLQRLASTLRQAMFQALSIRHHPTWDHGGHARDVLCRPVIIRRCPKLVMTLMMKIQQRCRHHPFIISVIISVIIITSWGHSGHDRTLHMTSCVDLSSSSSSDAAAAPSMAQSVAWWSR